MNNHAVDQEIIRQLIQRPAYDNLMIPTEQAGEDRERHSFARAIVCRMCPAQTVPRQKERGGDESDGQWRTVAQLGF